MPELPEVETVRRSLHRLLEGKRIAQVKVRERRLRKPLSPTFAPSLQNRTICRVDRRGKYLCLGLDNGQVWVVHLGMTGKLLIENRSGQAFPHDHVVIVFSDGLRLHYSDARRFGLMVVGEWGGIAEFHGLGVEPLGGKFTPAYLWAKFRLARRAVKDLLMDQRVVVGIGNIYASEILFRAGIRPVRRAFRLKKEQVGRVVAETRAVLREAIRYHGSSISDYLDGRGRKGAFQKRFCVYDREGQPCLVCAALIKRLTQGGRSSFFCPQCQR